MTSPGPEGRDRAGRGPAGDPAVVRTILALYPRRWRDRYAAEYASCLTEMLASASWPRRMHLLADALKGAMDAQLNPAGSARTDLIRRQFSVALCALIAFTIAGAGFQKMTEDPAFLAADHRHAAIAVSFYALRAAAVVAGVVVLTAAVPLLWTVVRQALAGRRDLLRLLALPPVAIAAWLGLARLVLGSSSRPWDRGGLNVAVVMLMLVLGAGVAVLCAWSTLAILGRAQLGDRLLRAQVVPMIALTVCMTVVTLADLSWGLSVRASDPALFGSDNGLLTTSLALSWLAGAVVLAATTFVTATASARAARHSAAARMTAADGQDQPG